MKRILLTTLLLATPLMASEQEKGKEGQGQLAKTEITCPSAEDLTKAFKGVKEIATIATQEEVRKKLNLKTKHFMIEFGVGYKIQPYEIVDDLSEGKDSFVFQKKEEKMGEVHWPGSGLNKIEPVRYLDCSFGVKSGRKAIIRILVGE